MKGEYDFEGKPKAQVDPKVFAISDVQKDIDLINRESRHGRIELFIVNGQIVRIALTINRLP